MVEAGSGEDELSIDWDKLLENIPHDPSFDFLDQSSSINGIEIEERVLQDNSNYAEKEDDPIVIEDGFSTDILLDSPPRPELVQTNREDKDDDEEPNNDDDSDAKKRKRQMRNRDAAVRSRERKKVYVRDLEMKSKCYEAECKRLGVLLQCCLAENQALRLSLHGNSSSKAFDGSSTSMTKQESAVLLLESLLLGSLLGLVGIITIITCLPILPMPIRLLENTMNGTPAPELARSSLHQAPRKAGNSSTLSPSLLGPSSPVSMMGKKYKASRSRMRKNIEAIEIRG